MDKEKISAGAEEARDVERKKEEDLFFILNEDAQRGVIFLHEEDPRLKRSGISHDEIGPLLKRILGCMMLATKINACFRLAMQEHIQLNEQQSAGTSAKEFLVGCHSVLTPDVHATLGQVISQCREYCPKIAQAFECARAIGNSGGTEPEWWVILLPAGFREQWRVAHRLTQEPDGKETGLSRTDEAHEGSRTGDASPVVMQGCYLIVGSNITSPQGSTGNKGIVSNSQKID